MTVKIMIFCLGIAVVLGAAILLILSKKHTSHLPQVANLFLTMRLDPQEQKEMAEYLNKRLAKDDLGANFIGRWFRLCLISKNAKNAVCKMGIGGKKHEITS